MFQRRFWSRFASAIAAVASTLAVAPGAQADVVPRTWSYLTTGNGHGFQVFDAQQNKITTFLDHPYRYLAPGPDPKSDGIGRRNLAFDVFFGVRAAGGSGWLDTGQAVGPEYVDQSNIIHAPTNLAGITADSYFFAPFGYEGNALVGVLHAPGATDGFALFNFHMGGAPGDTQPAANGESMRASGTDAAVETGPGGGAMVYVALTGLDHLDCGGPFNKVTAGQDLANNTSCSGDDQVMGLQKKLDSNGWLAVAMQFVEDPAQADNAAASLRAWAKGRTADAILNDAKSEFEAWRKPPAADIQLTDDERKLWRQSETTLRMGQIREAWGANGRTNTGMILASLPPGEWHTGWVRDAQYAIVALARMGHYDEAKAALDFFLGTNGPVGKFKQFVSNVDYRISVVRYFGTGEEQADYSGQQSPNVETDGWGMFMWSARQYVEASGDTAWLSAPTKKGDTAYAAIKGGVADALEANLEPSGIAKADSGIWEVHDQNKRHFAFTTMAAARGFCDMAVLAKKGGDAASVQKYQDLAKKVTTGFYAAFADPQGAIGGSVEGLSNQKYYDGSVAELFNWSVLTDYTSKTSKATLDLFNNLKVASGGFKRNNDGLSSYDDNEWILVDLRISGALRRGGRAAEADGYVAQLVSKAAANFYLLPELFNDVQADGQVGKYTGSIPMVGYGGGAYVMTILDRAGKLEPGDCTGDVTDGGGSSSGGTGGTGGPGSTGGAGGPGDNGAPSAAQLPYTPACLCNRHAVGNATPWGLVAIPWARVVRRVLRRRRRA